ncbi:MAG TPA: DUF3726 domain-containing protein [Afifellaceae bacterium]|nr:DUF3726 domain-containing protein [Afifellaceae bacterium]
MILSFGEVESLSQKAARGAGYSWGMAEETGKAVRWLEERNIPGLDMLANYLPYISVKKYVNYCPKADGECWSAPGQTLCPLCAGVALSDFADELPYIVTQNSVSFPVLLLPFAARASQYLGEPLTVEWAGTRAVCGPQRNGTVYMEGDAGTQRVKRVKIIRDGDPPPGSPAYRRRDIEPGTLDALQAFARKTFVAATEASRLAGAGAGVTDND